VAFYEAKNFLRVSARDRLRFGDGLLEQLARERAATLATRDRRVAALEKDRRFKRNPSRAPWGPGYPERGFVDLESAREVQHRRRYRTLKRATDRDSPSPRETEWGLHRSSQSSFPARGAP
jgi:hypothetical protein